jgi:hypothetical protein
MTETAGIELAKLEEPIHEALQTYSSLTEGQLEFDLDSAAKLVATPDKSTSARSQTAVKYLGERIGDLFVIAFKPQDGTGDEKTYRLDNLVSTGRYPREAKIVPRSKKGIYSEGHLAIVRQQLDDIHADPELFAGTYDLIGLQGNLINKIGELGHSATVQVDDMTPLTTLTTGYRPRPDIPTLVSERFGDPHAVYSSDKSSLQVAGFLAITDEVYKAHPDIMAGLNPQEPRTM